MYRTAVRPSEFCFITKDCANQFAYFTPQFTFRTKVEEDWSLKAELVGLLVHERLNHLYLYTLTDEHETGANRIAETLYWVFNNQAIKCSLPKTLFL